MGVSFLPSSSTGGIAGGGPRRTSSSWWWSSSSAWSSHSSGSSSFGSRSSRWSFSSLDSLSWSLSSSFGKMPLRRRLEAPSLGRSWSWSWSSKRVFHFARVRELATVARRAGDGGRWKRLLFSSEWWARRVTPMGVSSVEGSFWSKVLTSLRSMTKRTPSALAPPPSDFRVFRQLRGARFRTDATGDSRGTCVAAEVNSKPVVVVPAKDEEERSSPPLSERRGGLEPNRAS
mmetsp:Transcript_21724/g.69951  ORF Transcript_21724/g.69951 Transcript_21724/m.69951 type:complete len:231 (-) Transcript_21724:444-1136(-)